MKKKLENAYIPDKQTRKEKIVLGLSGLDSFVMAYLLKIQKYDLIGVIIINSWEEIVSDQSSVFSCHITPARLDSIRDFCHRLNIPLQVVKASSEFKDEVIEPWIGDKILARRPKPCWSCHKLRMEILFEKMKELGAKSMATGHYAKLFHHEAHGSVFVHTSNDEEHDQSELLSTLSHEVLNSLILPLSDLTKKEVQKLAENFGIIQEEKTIKFHECLKMSDELIALLHKKVPKKFLQEGEIMNPEGNESYGLHTGIISYTLGETIEIRQGGRAHKGVFGSYVYPEKKMIICDEAFFRRKELVLKNCHFSEEVTWPEPVKGFLVLNHDYVECWVHPKSLSSVYVELSEERKLMDGTIVSVIKKKGRNSKIFLSGEVTLLPLETLKNEGEEGVPKIDPAVDY